MMDEFFFDEEKHIGTYQGNLVKSVTTILQEEGFIDTTWFTEYGRVKGTYTHKAILLDNNGTLDEDTVDDAIRGRLEAARKFRIETGFEIIEQEVRHFDKTLMLTGKPDVVGHLYGRPAIIDYKPWTLQWYTRYQLAAYQLFFDKAMNRYALRLGDDGRYQLHKYEDRTDAHSFLAILTTNRLKQRR